MDIRVAGIGNWSGLHAQNCGPFPGDNGDVVLDGDPGGVGASDSRQGIGPVFSRQNMLSTFSFT